jgi:hypothetical protein
MYQNAIRTVRRQDLEPKPDRILAGRAAANRRQHGEPGDGLLEERSILGPDYHQHLGDPRVAGECGDCMAKNSGAREREILFGQGTPEATPLTSRNYQSVDGRHRSIYPGKGRSLITAVSLADIALQKEKF